MIIEHSYTHRLNEAKENIHKAFSSTENIVLGFSGGKDSTVLLHLTLEVLINYADKKVNLIVVHCNTLVDNPVIAHHCTRFMGKAKKYVEEKKIPFVIQSVAPKLESSFWSNLIGKGYALPHRLFRWCQRTLKIEPMENFIKKFNTTKTTLLLGHRLDESALRKQSLRKNGSGAKMDNYGKVMTIAPIAHLQENDIWRFLTTQDALWGGGYEQVIEIYKEARGECPLLPEKNMKLSGCGSRFGCWVCTLVKEDKSLKNQARKQVDLKPYLNFRNWLVDFCSKETSRYPFTRTGKMVQKGCLSINARKHILHKLLNLQSKLNREIITHEEIRIIQMTWQNDKIRFKKMGFNLNA